MRAPDRTRLRRHFGEFLAILAKHGIKVADPVAMYAELARHFKGAKALASLDAYRRALAA
jgi:hypothetical protein